MPPIKQNEETKVEIEEIKKTEENSDVSVEFDAKGEPVKKEEAKKTDTSSVDQNLQKYQVELEKTRNFYFANQRKLEEQLRQINERLAPQQKETAAPANEWDTKVQKDWKGTVEELAEKRFEQLQARQTEIARVKAREDQENTIRENGKRTALQKYPDLNDETSEKAVIYRQIVMENPDYLTNPRGPILAMRDMEEKLREQGKFVDEPTKQYVEKEVVRQTRANAGAPPTGTRSKANVIVLSKEEKEFCDNHGLKYESYAKSKRMTSASQGVEA